MTTKYLPLIRQDCPVPPGTPVDIYCRDSGGETQERSVAQQREAALEYVGHHGLILHGVYIDEALTGSNAERRDELNRMLADIAAEHRQIRDLTKRERHMQRNPRAVIVWKSNRLGRDTVETNLTKNDLRVRGITIIDLQPSVTTGDITVDAILEAVQMAQDEKLLKEISRDSKRGLAELVGIRDTDEAFRAHNPDWPTCDGRYVGFMPGPPPRGFRKETLKIGTSDRRRRGGKAETREAQRLVPDPDEWGRARRAWEMRIAGASIADILRETRLYASEGGYKTFFTNRIYTGVLEYGGREYAAFVPALVTQAEFDAVQEIVRANAAKRYNRPGVAPNEPRRASSRHLLSGLVYCDAHTEPVMMHANVDGHGWDHYQCSRRKECGTKRVSAAAVNRAVTDALMTSVLTPERLQTVASEMAAALAEQSGRDAQALKVLEKELKAAREAVDHLVQAVEAGRYSPALANRLTEREADVARLETKAAALRASAAGGRKAQAVSEAQIAEWLEAVRGALGGDDPQNARAVLGYFVARVLIRDGYAHIDFTYPVDGLETRIRAVTPTGLGAYPCFRVYRKLRYTRSE